MIELDLCDYLSDLETSAKDRVFPLVVPQGVSYPAITVQLTAKDRVQTQAGLTGSEQSTFALHCHTRGDNARNQYSDCKSLVNSLVSSINTYVSGVIPDVYAITIGNEVDENYYFLDGNQGGIQSVTLEITTYKKG